MLTCHPDYLVMPDFMSCRIYSGIAFLVLSRKNCLVRFHELLEFHGAISRGGGGELCSLDSGCFFAVFFVELVGGGACAKDALDFRFGEERGNVVGDHIFDACVACPNDGATVKNVPQCDMMLQEHGAFFVDGRGERLV